MIIQAPRGTAAQLTPYRPAFDVTGADIYPVSYPPGIHAGGANKDISVVGVNNTVTYKTGDPKVSDLGSGNQISKG